jgi:hypothetical protein
LRTLLKPIKTSLVITVVPDDMRIEIILIKIVPVKSIKGTVTVRSKENTDNVK